MLLVAFALAVGPLSAHDPITTKLTFSQEISRILYRRCASCHRAGGRAPMSLMTYEEVRPWATAIREEVLERRMPPWGAVKGVGEFRDDPSLTQPEIDRIVNWVEGGAPEGDPIYLPPPPNLDHPERTAKAGRPDWIVTRERVLAAPTLLVAVEPRGLKDGGSLEVAAELPDGGVERLVWLRDWRAAWQRTFVFQQPVRLPKGTKLLVWSTDGAVAAFSRKPVSVRAPISTSSRRLGATARANSTLR